MYLAEFCRKRAAARQLIERYYYQLTDGCGKTDCNNEYCASSTGFDALSKNDAAVKAITLFKNKAQLCETGQPSKIPKGTEGASADSEDSGGTSSASSRPCTSSSLSSLSTKRSPTENSKTSYLRMPSTSSETCKLSHLDQVYMPHFCDSHTNSHCDIPFGCE